MKLVCPSCNGNLEVDTIANGLRGPCPHCSKKLEARVPPNGTPFFIEVSESDPTTSYQENALPSDNARTEVTPTIPSKAEQAIKELESLQESIAFSKPKS